MLAVQPTPAPPAAGVSGALRDVVAADESPPGPSSTSSSTSSTSDDTRPDSGRAFSDDPRPGDKENPFRAPSPNNTSPSAAVRPVKTAVNGAPDSSVAARLSKSQSVIESLQRSLVTKLSPATIESLKSKYASTAAAAPLARPEADLDVDPKLASPLLPVKSVAEATKQSKPLSNGKPAAAVFDVSNAESQSSVKLAFLSGEPAARQQQPARPVTRRAAVERKPLHFPKTVPAAKPPVPAKKDELRAHGKPQVLAVPKKKTPAKPSRASVAQDGLSELLKNLVSDSPTTADKPTERLRRGERGATVQARRELSFTTASTRPPKPQPAPRTTSLPPHLASPNTPVSPSSTPCPRPPSLSPVQRPSPATSPGRTPPERSRLLEDKLNEIRKDLWEEEAAAAADGRRQRHDSLPGSVSEDAAVPPRSVQEATLEHYARAIQKHLDGRAPAPRLSELRVDTSSSAHSSTSTLVSTPSQSPGWASSTGEPRSLPPTSRSVSSPPPTSPQRRRLRDELLGFYYRSLEREARRPPGRSGRLSAPPLPFTAVIPTDHATYTPDRTLRQEFIVVRDGSPAPEATYQNVHLVRPPPGSPLLASGEDSDSTVQDGRSRPRANMNFFVRGGPQRNTIGAYPTRRTPPRDEVDLRREFGGEVELRHPEKLNAINNKKRHNSESEAADPVVMPVNGRSKNGKPGVFEAWGASNGKDAAKGKNKANGSSNGKKSLFPIFRKGSLHPSAPTTPGTPPPTLPKRVSFSSSTSPMYAANNPTNGDGWPTRNGTAATPPTRPSRLDSSDSVFLPNSPGYACSDTEDYTRRYRHQENIYANQYAVAPGEGTYVNYTMPTPPELAANGGVPRMSSGATYGSGNGVYGTARSQQGQQGQQNPQAAAVVYGNTQRPPTGAMYGTTQQTAGSYGTAAQPGSGVYGTRDGTIQQTPSSVYGTTQQTSPNLYGSSQQTPSSVYGSSQQTPSGVYGSTQQTAPGVFGSSPATPSGLYGTAQKPPSGVYGSTPKSSAGVYGSSSAGVYGTRQQPSPVPYRPPPTGGESPYGTKADHSSPYGTKADHSSPYGTKADHSSPYGTKADHSSPYGTKASPNGVAYSPSQPPAGPAATGSSPGSASVRSAPSPAGTSTSFNASNASFNALNASFNASNASFNASNASSASVSPHGLHLQQQRVYGRAGLPPRAQSATPTMMTMMAPDRPLPPIPIAAARTVNGGLKHSQLTLSESESGSEAGEVQRILQQANDKRKITYCKLEGERSRVHDSGSQERRHRFSKRSEEEWGVGGKGRGPGDMGGPPGGGVRGDEEMRRGGGRGGRGGRDDPRRHTLGGDQHSLPPQGGTLSRSMDLEMSAKQRKKSPMARGYPPPSNAMLFDDDPGIMSEVETSSTGFHRGGKQRSSLPVVRTPSKTLERPLGLVFLQYRNETKRALLPNEITSLDTVKALFVRSFSKQLTMEYLDSPHVKIYSHDSNKDMFYELEDHRSHLRDIRDRSVLRLFEATDLHSGVFPGAGTGLVPPTMWETDQSYFSEPEFDSEYQHQHIHKSKASKSSGVPPQPYYMTHSFPPGAPGAPGPGVPGSSATLPRGGSLMRAYSPAPKSLPPSDRLHAESGYMSSPERGGPRAYPAAPYPASASVSYEEGYYGQYGTRSGSITPVIDEEASDTELMDEQYALYGVKLPGGGVGVMGPGPRGPPAAARAPFPTPAGPPYDVTRIRVENMERQLANLTGLVQKALTHGPTHLAVPGAQGYRNASGEFDTHGTCSPASQDDPTFVRSDVKPPKLGKDKSVSFEKSVSFSDEPPDMNSPKQHSPQHGADTKPTKPAIKSSTLPRTSSQERDRHKPAPPPKPMSLSPGQYEGRNIYRDLQLTPEMYNQLRGLQKKAKDLRQEVRNLRRMSQAQAHSVRETIRDTFIKIRAMLITGAEGSWAAIGDAEKLRLSREEELYKQEMLLLEKNLTELESTVEELRGNVINRKTRVNMSDVENMALILSKSSKTVADLKVRFPGLQDEMKSLLSAEMDKVMREEKFLKEEPERLESALRRCKKLTGTLVTLKRLASVQEQRLPCPPGAVGADARLSPTLDDEPLPPTPNSATSKACPYGSTRHLNDSGGEPVSGKRPENALDALLDELQTFAKPPTSSASASASASPAPGQTATHPPTMAEIGRRKGSIETNNPPQQQQQAGAAGAVSAPSNPTSSLRRLHSYPSSSDGGGNSPPSIARLQVSDSKPPVPERNADLLAKRVPPPPPPRTSSRSPLASPTSPSLPPRTSNPPSQPQMGTQGTLRRAQVGRGSVRSSSIPGADPLRNPVVTALSAEEQALLAQPPGTAAASNSSSCESVNSQEGAAAKKERQEALEQRHQELLRKQRALQEQYARLQQLQRGTATVPTPDLLLKKTGSESNLLAKMGMQGLSAAAPMSGSLTHLASAAASTPLTTAQTTTSKIYETDIL